MNDVDKTAILRAVIIISNIYRIDVAFGDRHACIIILVMHAQTRRQREVLDFITRYVESHGYRPSYQSIARHLGVRSKGGIARLVGALEEQGLIERRRENGHFSLEFPGREFTAGSGLLIEWLDVPDDGEHREDWKDRPFAVPEFMLGLQTPDRIRAFQVPDNAMAGDNICEDDVALIELRQFVRDGDRVVAVLNKERAVLRKYYRAGAYIELHESDDDKEMIRLTADRVEIKGVFRGLLRPVV